MLCCLLGYCVFVFYKRKRINGEDKTPYEKWMEQYENKNNSTHLTPVNSTHQTPVNSTHGYAYSTNPLHTSKHSIPPPPPPPSKNPLRRPSSTHSPSMRRSSNQRHSSASYGMYDMYGSNDRVISSNNPLHS